MILIQIQNLLKAQETAKAKMLLEKATKILEDNESKTLEPILANLWAEYYVQISDYKLAESTILASIGSLSENDPAYPMLLQQLSALDLHLGRYDSETKVRLRKTISLAEKLGDIGTAGDAAFNLGTILNLEGEDENALDFYYYALKAYECEGRAMQKNDCLHMIGTILRMSYRDKEALALLRPAFKRAIELQNHPAIVGCGGDLARTLYCIWLDESIKEEQNLLDEANLVLTLVSLSDDLLWKNAGLIDAAIGARLHHANRRFNNIETTILVDNAMENTIDPFFALAKAKCAVLFSKIEKDLISSSEIFRELDESLASLPHKELWISTIPISASNLAKKTNTSIGIADQFALSGNRIYTFCQVLNTKDDWHGPLFSNWPIQTEMAIESVRGSYGKGQGILGQKLAKTLVCELEKIVGLASMIFDENCNAKKDFKDFLIQESEGLRESLSLMGDWLFPKELCDAFDEEPVDHVYISPDPRLWSIPWNALILGNGRALIDQTWSWSLLPSTGFLHLLGQFSEKKNEIVVLQPDREIYANLGGKEEISAIKIAGIDGKLLLFGDADIESFNSLTERENWIHIRTHGALSPNTGTFVPKLSNGFWDKPVSLKGPSTLISACCRTAETASSAQDVLGLIEVAISSGFSSILAPIVSLDGILASKFFSDFYLVVAEGKNVFEAQKKAAIKARETFIHPAFWAPFILVGDFNSRLNSPAASTK